MRLFMKLFLALVLVGAFIIGVFFLKDYLPENIGPTCGDGECTGNECQEGCQDCSAQQCRDGVCTLAIETCTTSEDCPCPLNTICVAGRETADAYGCATVSCGDGSCDREYETTEDCCQDCGCVTGYTCQNNVCFLSPPRVGFSTLLLRQAIGGTTLAVNPLLKNASGTPHPFVAVVMTNAGSRAENVFVEFQMERFGSKSVFIPQLAKGAEIPIQWHLEQNLDFLGVQEDTDVDINVTLKYIDSEGISHQVKRVYPFTILDRGTIDSVYGDISFFVTPDDVDTTLKTAAGIWSEIQSKVNIVEHERIQYPKETLILGEGSQQDITLLLASVYFKHGFDPAFITTSENKTFLWIRVYDDYITLDPERLEKPYSYAVVEKIGRIDHIKFVSKMWDGFGVHPAVFDPLLISGTGIRTKTTLDDTCDCVRGCEADLMAVHNVSNQGLARADLCGESYISVAGDSVIEDSWCFTVWPGDHVLLNQSWSGDVNGCSRIRAEIILRNETQ